MSFCIVLLYGIWIIKNRGNCYKVNSMLSDPV